MPLTDIRDPAVAERFWAKADRCDPDECWLWLPASKRYGQFRLRDRNLSAHRVAYELAHGPIPKGMTIDHLCWNKRCVNPGHMELVTGTENTRRYMATITHCPQGHPYDASNTYIGKRGRWRTRQCRACDRDRKRRYYAGKSP